MSFRFLPPGRALRWLALSAVACATACPAEPPLTLAEAQRLALKRSLQLQGQQSALVAAREMAVAAGQLPDPVLSAGIDNLPVDGADRYRVGADFMTMRRIGLAQELTASDKRQLRSARYQSEAKKILAEQEQAGAAIERDTALAWLQRSYALDAAALAAQLAEQAGLEVSAADSAYRGGRGSQAELLAARGNAVLAEDRAADLARRARSAGIQLARWTGAAADADAPLAARPDLELDPELSALAPDTARLASDLAHHPLIAVLTAQQQIAETDAGLAQAARSADWTVSVAFQQRGGAYSNMLSVGLSVPLQWDRKNRQDRELAAKLALAGQAGAERDEALRAHVAETAAMAEEWRGNRQRLQRYQRDLLPLAEQRSQALLAAYRGGKAALAEVLSARRGETEMRLQALQLEADTARLWAELSFLLPSHGRAAGEAP